MDKKNATIPAAVSGYVSSVNGDFTLADHIKAPVISIDLNDYAGVICAVHDLCADIAAVTNIAPVISKINLSRADVIIGTIGKNTAIDKLISEGKMDVSDISGKWECFKIQIVDQTLVIAGSDKRGTIYGIYDLSEKIGVSPWYWWADVVPGHAEGLYVSLAEPYTEYEPSVKYRGIFLNDEYAFHNWAIHHGDEDYIEIYKHLYELLLRLKANFLWPAMHNYSPWFHKNPVNAANADLYGIVVGSSHCEMFLRNNPCEYFDFETKWEKANPGKPLYKAKLSDSPEPCAYVYVDTNPYTGEHVYNKELLQAYWRESIELYGRYENLYTIGMRGLHDAKWQPAGVKSNAEKAVLLEEIIGVQREILAEVLGKNPSEVPQVFIPYKEIQEIYDSGMEVPDDITLMWTDDNYGYIRQLPTDNNRGRSGGAGIYYHVSYHGYPNSYLWLCTTPLALIREEMSKAYDFGAKNVWVVNVGDLKPAENQMEYLLRLARDVNTVRNKDLQEYIAEKAIRDFKFSKEEAREYAGIALEFHQAAYARKPEFFGADNFNFEGYGLSEQQHKEALANKPKFVLADLFNCEAFGDEGQQYLSRYQKLVERSEALYDKLDKAVKPSFFELQLYPLRSCYNTAKKNIYAVKSNLYFKQGRGTIANKYAEASDDLYYYVIKDTKEYNSLLSKKWNRIMDPYQTFFRSCGAGLPKLLETSKATGHTELGAASEKMVFSGYAKDVRFIDVYNVGYNPIQWKASAEREYIILSKDSGVVLNEERIWVGIDWAKVPRGITFVSVTINQMMDEIIIKSMSIPINIVNTVVELPEKTYAEANGYVSIEAEHYSSMTRNGAYEWRIEKNLGRSGDSIKAYPNLASSVKSPDRTNSSYVDYNIYFESTGTFDVDIYRIPTLNERGGTRFAIGLDDELPAVLSGTNAYVNDSNGTDSWGKGVLENNETLATKITVSEPGKHTLRLYSVDTGVVIDKIVITTGAKVESYFGAPESYNSTYNYLPALLPEIQGSGL